MTKRTIDEACEFVAREFLGCVERDFGTHKAWVIAALGRKPDWDTPAPSWDFYGALWKECRARDISVMSKDDTGKRYTSLRSGTCGELRKYDGDPREALVRCVEQWCDGRAEGEG